MLKGGVVFTWYLEVLAILKGGGAQKFPLFKRGAQKVLPCLEGGEGGAQKVSDPRFSHLVAPPTRN